MQILYMANVSKRSRCVRRIMSTSTSSKVHMSEAELAKRFEDAVYHIEHQPYELNFVGKYALSELTRQHGYKVVLTGEFSNA